MRLVNIANYDYDSMQLAKPVYDGRKRILLASGRHIHPKLLDRLKDMDISHLFVEDDVSRGISLDEMIDMPTWMDAINVVKDAYEKVKKNGSINIISIQKTIGKLILEVEKRPVIVLVPTSTQTSELKAFAHTVNVTLLSLLIGRKLRLNKIQLRDLGIGALLHDIGKVISTNEEDHPKAGFEILRGYRELNLLSAHVAYQHHEALNGEGYPRGVKGNDFHKFAQICGIANLYENMISFEDVPPHHAMEMMMTKSGTVYETDIVHALVQGVPAYPPGTKIELNTREEAIVTRIESHMQRPVVRTIEGEREISLEDHSTIIITGIVKD